MTMSDAKVQINPTLKFILDIGPLILFFFANARPAFFLPAVAPIMPAGIASGEHAGIFVATAVFMAAIVIALIISYIMTWRLPLMPVISAIIVLVFGSLTLFLQDETFIKLKPTMIYLLFAAVLFGGHLFDKPVLAVVFDSVFHLTSKGWRILNLRWALFFLGMAVLNEIVWRTQTTDTWVTFKVFGVLPITLIFGALQLPLLNKYAAPAPAKD
jgi:intracellular septation protein